MDALHIFSSRMPGAARVGKQPAVFVDQAIVVSPCVYPKTCEPAGIHQAEFLECALDIGKNVQDVPIYHSAHLDIAVLKPVNFFERYLFSVKASSIPLRCWIRDPMQAGSTGFFSSCFPLCV